MSAFSLAVDKWAAKVSVDVKKFTKLVAFQVHDRIVMRTPVDTGRARASWTIVAGSNPDTSVQPESFEGGAAAGIALAKSKQSSVPDSNTYVIANSLPYIERLENGWSKQSPTGFVRLGIADVKTRLEVELGQ